MYPSDFGEAGPSFTPVEPTLFLGLGPLLALLALLLVTALAAGMFFAGRRQAREEGAEGSNAAPKEIYELILRHASAARSANSNELKAKAEVLERKIDQYLGPVIVLGKDLAGFVKDLKAAGEGKVEEAAKVDPKPAAEAGNHACRCGGTAPARSCGCAGNSTPAVAPVPMSINQIYIGAPPAVAGCQPTGKDAHAPACGTPSPSKSDQPEDKPKPKPTKRDMTVDEQIEALDKAVRAFNDYWLDRETRITQLKAAQRALNTRPPKHERGEEKGLWLWDRSQPGQKPLASGK